MNPTRFSSSAIALSPVRTPDGAPIPDLYSLKASLPNSEESLSFRAIHVPASLLPSLNKASQVSPALLNIESLNFNGRYSQALPGSPRYLLTGVTTDGKLEQNIPLPLKRRARAFCFGGTLGASVGVVLLAVGFPWLGASALILGTHALRTAWQAPGR